MEPDTPPLLFPWEWNHKNPEDSTAHASEQKVDKAATALTLEQSISTKEEASSAQREALPVIPPPRQDRIKKRMQRGTQKKKRVKKSSAKLSKKLKTTSRRKQGLSPAKNILTVMRTFRNIVRRKEKGKVTVDTFPFNLAPRKRRKKRRRQKRKKLKRRPMRRKPASPKPRHVQKKVIKRKIIHRLHRKKVRKIVQKRQPQRVLHRKKKKVPPAIKRVKKISLPKERKPAISTEKPLPITPKPKIKPLPKPLKSSFPSSYETEIDQLYKMIQEKGKMRLDEVMNTFKIKKELAEEWAMILETHLLITITYPPFGWTILKRRETEMAASSEGTKP